MTDARDEQLLDLVASYRQLAKDQADTLEHGSRNFRRYRRRAIAGFAALTLACSFAIWWAVRVGQEGQRDLAHTSARVQFQSCHAGNQVRDGIVAFLEYLAARSQHPEQSALVLKQARVFFATRDCERIAAQLTQ